MELCTGRPPDASPPCCARHGASAVRELLQHCRVRRQCHAPGHASGLLRGLRHRRRGGGVHAHARRCLRCVPWHTASASTRGTPPHRRGRRLLHRPGQHLLGNTGASCVWRPGSGHGTGHGVRHAAPAAQPGTGACLAGASPGPQRLCAGADTALHRHFRGSGVLCGAWAHHRHHWIRRHSAVSRRRGVWLGAGAPLRHASSAPAALRVARCIPCRHGVCARREGGLHPRHPLRLPNAPFQHPPHRHVRCHCRPAQQRAQPHPRPQCPGQAGFAGLHAFPWPEQPQRAPRAWIRPATGAQAHCGGGQRGGVRGCQRGGRLLWRGWHGGHGAGGG